MELMKTLNFFTQEITNEHIPKKGTDFNKSCLVKSLGNQVYQINFNDINSLEFYDTRFLKVIDMSSAGIKSIGPDVFQNLSHLEQLSIEDNKIVYLPKELLQNLSQLETLNISFNKICSLHSSSFDSLLNLKALYISNNQLSSVSELFKNLHNLEVLDLQHNCALRILNNDFKGLLKLKEMHLSFDSIEIIEKEAFQKCPSIENLFLEETCFEKITSADRFRLFRSIRHSLGSKLKMYVDESIPIRFDLLAQGFNKKSS